MLLSAAAAASLLGAAPAAHADDDDVSVEEVVVTVRRRTEKLQDVPITVSAIGGQTLAEERLDRVADYAAKIANFNALQQNTRVSTLTIRGVGGNANSDGSEAGVGLIVDNVFFTHPGFSWLDFVDLESVELARGPQGTLLGKNTTIGALVVTTKRPSFTPEGQVSATIANHERYQVRANVSGPLIGDKLAGRLTIYRDVGGGFITNKVDGQDYLGNDRWALRGQLLFENGDFSNRLIAEHYETKEYNNFYPPAGDPPTFANGAARNGWERKLRTAFGYLPSYDTRHNADLDTQEEIVSRTDGVSNQFDWRLGGHTLTSVTAWRRLYFRPKNDSDLSPYAIFRGGYDVDVDQYSQELRLASPTNGQFDYQAGVFLLKQEVSSNFRTLFFKDASAFFLSPALPSLILDGLETNQVGKAETTSVAIFGQGTWRFDDRASLTAGLRYTWEKREASNRGLSFGGVPLTGPLASLAAYRAAVAGQPFYVEGEKESGAVSWLINPAYKLTDDILAYASISYGEKSGAANLGARPGDPVIIQPEKSIDYEIGLKTTWLDGRAYLNANLYWNDITDYQATLTTVTGAVPRSYLANVGKVRLRGLELEGQAQITPALRVSGSAAFAEAKYESYRNAPPPQELLYPGAPAFVDLSGTNVPFAPKFTGQISVNYEEPIRDDLVLFAYANQTWRSSTFQHALSQYGRQDAYGLTHAGLGLKSANGHWSANVWARNLFDKKYAAAFGNASANTPYIAILGEPRTFGLTLTGRY
ncbi:TonB-dependent receptor [Phenylobacterium sp.]|uniref:TonB-dependent receptor n=1 Tax=Phenylobacterium sp. TaxID=1871053 RepID=UPI0035AD925C